MLHPATLLERGAAPFRRLLEVVLQALLEGQMTQFVGAAPGERSRARSGHRAGHAQRRLDTRFGTLALRVPRDRSRRFSTALPDRYPHAERALIALLGQRWVGASAAAEIAAVAEALCGHALGGRGLNQFAQGLDAALSQYQCQLLEEPFARLFLQSRDGPVHLGHCIRSCRVLTVIGVDRQGRRRTLGAALADHRPRAAAEALLRRLWRGGLQGVECVVADGHDGLRRAWRAAWGESGTAQPRRVPAWRRDERSAARAVRAACAVSDAAPNATPPADAVRDDGHGPPRTAGLPHGHMPADLPSRAPLGPRARWQGTPWRTLAALAAAFGVAGVATLHIGTRIEAAPSSAVAAAAPPAAVDPMPREPAAAPPLPAAPPSTAPAPARARLQLVGVAATRAADGPGLALIGVDGGPPQPYRVGARVVGDLVLKGTTWDRATLGPAHGPATLVLDVVVPAVADAARSVAHGAAALRPVALAAADLRPEPGVSDDVLPGALAEVQAPAEAPSPAPRHRARRAGAVR